MREALCLMRHKLTNTALKWIYSLILGGLFGLHASVVVPLFRIADLVPTLLAFCFFTGYVLYLATYKKHFLTLSVSFYLIYTALMVWHTFLYPLVSPQEYIVAIVVYSILGVPLLAGVVANFKHNKQRQQTHKSAPLL
jgi:hypothetical protein